jgi:phenylalanyl-tRNA synthetase alpha chain
MTTLRDLTDPSQGHHALQDLLDLIELALAAAWDLPVQRHRADPVVSVADNYDRLGYPPEAVTRDARYTRYVAPGRVLRTHTSAMIPPLLERLAASPTPDLVLSCPGLVYRRDVIDRTHVGEPHQVDLWRIRRTAPGLTVADLRDMIALVVDAAVPGRRWRAVAARHPYTTDGLQIDVEDTGSWVEVGECGLAAAPVLAGSRLSPATSGLAMGLGLDRLLMLRKGIDDIRLLRSADPRVTVQMADLAPYRPVSAMPPARRDLSIAAAADTTPEELGDQVRAALGERAGSVEQVRVLAETPWRDVPVSARIRLGLRPDERNVLLRVVLRDLDRTLTAAEVNELRDRIYAAVHHGGQGSVSERRTSSSAEGSSMVEGTS